MATKRTLTIVRSGEFTLRTFGENHCGTENKFDVRYKLEVLCSPRVDKRGFLFDQVNIDKYFRSIKRTSKSCEMLTRHCLDELRRHILKENPGCELYHVNLTLSPAPYGAAMTQTWECIPHPHYVADGSTPQGKTKRARHLPVDKIPTDHWKFNA